MPSKKSEEKKLLILQPFPGNFFIWDFKMSTVANVFKPTLLSYLELPQRLAFFLARKPSTE
jgi:hypothetical protein